MSERRAGDTIAALSSGHPPAAIAIIRTSGSLANSAAEALAGALPPARVASLRTLVDPKTGIEIDSALVLRFAAPCSATGEDVVEYQCHGGRAVVTAVLAALTSSGLRQAKPGEFTRRAVEHGRLDLTEAEGLADLLEAETEAQRRAALAMAGGALSRQIDSWQSLILELSARAEAGIDYVGDTDETAIDTTVLLEETQRLSFELSQWLLHPRSELLKEGLRVVVAGPPNVGKSSLINAMTGFDRAIVTPIAGTTRDVIEVPMAIDGMPFLLIDTAGLRESNDSIEKIGIKRALAEMHKADLLLWLGEAGQVPGGLQAILVHPKSDLRKGRHDALEVSSRTGAGIAELLSRLSLEARMVLPVEDRVALNNRQAALIGQAALLLEDAPDDLLLLAEVLRAARCVFDRLTGRAGIEEALDGLFDRFCLGK